MNRSHNIKEILITNEDLNITIDEKNYRFNLKEISSVLYKASTKERETYEISPSGYGIHWPLIDEDLSIDGLLGIVHTPDQSRQYA